MDANEIIDRILPEKRNQKKDSPYLQYDKGFNHCRDEARFNLRKSYGKEWVGVPSVDDLANIIRTADGNHDKGAGELAESILKGLKGNRGTAG